MKVPEDVLEVLNNATVDGNTLALNGQLDRNLYMKTNKVLETLGGKWNRKLQKHIFDSDVEDVISGILNFGEYTDMKKELQFFPTPKTIVFDMLKLAEIQPGNLILEPSAGEGAIADTIANCFGDTKIHCAEINPTMAKKLADTKIYDCVMSGNFLAMSLAPEFDRVIMNPPFSKQQDIDHVNRAVDCLRPGGILVAIMSEGTFFRNNAKSIKFREFLSKYNAEIIELDEGAFKESGTMVKTRIIKIRMPE